MPSHPHPHEPRGMSVKKILIVGYGEVGKPFFELVRGVCPSVDWLDVENKQLDVKPDIMHITFPEQTQTDFV